MLKGLRNQKINSVITRSSFWAQCSVRYLTSHLPVIIWRRHKPTNV